MNTNGNKSVNNATAKQYRSPLGTCGFCDPMLVGSNKTPSGEYMTPFVSPKYGEVMQFVKDGKKLFKSKAKAERKEFKQKNKLGLGLKKGETLADVLGDKERCRTILKKKTLSI